MKFTSAIIGATIFSTASASNSLEQFKADMKAKSEGMDGFIFDDYCATICFFTPSCRFDPHHHGSYCKTDNFPQTCFGLYRLPSFFPRFCFQPNDSSCPVWIHLIQVSIFSRKSSPFSVGAGVPIRPRSKPRLLPRILDCPTFSRWKKKRQHQ